jgi:hypothetical protein
MQKCALAFLIALVPLVTLAFDSSAGLHDPTMAGVPGVSASRMLLVANVDIVVGGNEFSVADGCDLIGNHFHSDDGGSFGNGPDFMEVGDYTCEEVRGMVEFDLAGLLPRFTASVTCSVFREGGLFNGVNDFLTVFDVDTYAYHANNAEDLSDFQVSTPFFLYNFSTGGLTVGDTVSFDVTTASQDALVASAALGVRMQPGTDPQGGAITFEQCNLMISGKVVDIDIKFCSNPNAFNTKNKGGFPVTIFGNGVDVTAIDLNTLQLCNDAAGTDCTPAGLKTFSMADRGDPTTDLGADQCTLIDTDGDGVPDTETDWLNPDGFLDLDAVFYAQDVADLIGPVSRNDVVGPLYLVGYLNDATPITSVPVAVDMEGVDWLVIKK